MWKKDKNYVSYFCSVNIDITENGCSFWCYLPSTNMAFPVFTKFSGLNNITNIIIYFMIALNIYFLKEIT